MINFMIKSRFSIRDTLFGGTMAHFVIVESYWFAFAVVLATFATHFIIGLISGMRPGKLDNKINKP